MDFTEAHEWRSLFTPEKAIHGRGKTRRGWRCAYQDELDPRPLHTVHELGGIRCTVNELLGFSPECSTQGSWPAEWSVEPDGCCDSQEMQATLDRFEAAQIALDAASCGSSSARVEPKAARNPTRGFQGPQTPQHELQTPQLPHCDSPSRHVAQSSTARESFQGSTAAAVVARKGPKPRQAVGLGDGVLKPASFTPAASAVAAESADDTGLFRPQLFVRRLPEKYLRLDSVESTLTSRLRWQASHDQINLFPGFVHMASSGAAAAQKVEVQVHLPPFTNSEASVVVMVVAATMRVEELQLEVLCQQGSHLGSDAKGFEMRLYDEDEEEPDYDLPPFDKSLEVGALGVTDVALCPAHAADSSTDSSPALAASSEKACGGDEATDASEVVPQVAPPQAAEVGVSFAPTQPELVSPSGGTSSNTPRLPQRLPVPIEAPATKPLRKVSDSEVVTRTDQAVDAVATGRRFNHRRCRSSPHPAPVAPVVVGGFEELDAAVSACVSIAEAVATESSGARPWLPMRHSASIGATGPSGGTASEIDDANGVRTRQLRIVLPDGAAHCGAHVSPASAANAALDGDAGGSEGSMNTVASTLTPVSKRSAELAAAELVLDVRDDATLLEVLEKLKVQWGRYYDPVNFAFERIDDGIKQRLDLDMQVKQLQPHSNILTLVRKDAPVALSPVAEMNARRLEELTLSPNSRQLDSLRRPLPSAFFFNEYTASIATEYFVTVAARGSRSRPCECHLVVDRERLYHQPLRGCSYPAEGSNQEKSSFMSTLTKKLVKPWSLTEGSRTEPSIFKERRVCDVRKISCDDAHQRGFFVVYGGGASDGSLFELVYQAYTPTECAEIVARVQFLLTLAK